MGPLYNADQPLGDLFDSQKMHKLCIKGSSIWVFLCKHIEENQVYIRNILYS